MTKTEALADIDAMQSYLTALRSLFTGDQTITDRSPTTLADMFAPHAGTHEYDGIVAEIQKWYYGSLVKASWCATSVSYFWHALKGNKILHAENVKVLLDQCKSSGMRLITELTDMRRGDIVFFLWDKKGPMTTTSSKHVSIYTGSPSQYIGGNQDDSICIKTYPADSIYAVYRPNYK